MKKFLTDTVCCPSEVQGRVFSFDVNIFSSAYFHFASKLINFHSQDLNREKMLADDFGGKLCILVVLAFE